MSSYKIESLRGKGCEKMPELTRLLTAGLSHLLPSARLVNWPGGSVSSPVADI